MPNYLQRILISGARATSSTRPPAMPRALVPPISPPVHGQMGEADLQTASDLADSVLPAQRVRNEPTQMAEYTLGMREHDAVSSTVMPREALPREPIRNLATDRIGRTRTETALPTAAAMPPLAPYPSTSGVRVRAPKGLRRSEGGNERLLEIIRTGGEPPLQTSNEVLMPPSIETPQVSQEATNLLERKPAVANPAPVITRTPDLPARGSATQNATLEGMIPVKAEAVPAQAMQAAMPLRVEGQRPVADRQISETSLFEVRPTVPRQMAQPLVSNTTDKRRRSQISIGRIDVQVNNQPAQPLASPPSAKPQSHSSFLDTRYLSRFFFRP